MITMGKFIIGYSDPNTVMLDFDDCGLVKTKKECERLTKKYALGGYLIARSSSRHYHAVFSAKVSYKRVCAIIDDSPCYGQQELRLRELKGFTTLRISPINSKFRPRAAPEIVYVAFKGSEVGRILPYLESLSYYSPSAQALVEKIDLDEYDREQAKKAKRKV